MHTCLEPCFVQPLLFLAASCFILLRRGFPKLYQEIRKFLFDSPQLVGIADASTFFFSGCPPARGRKKQGRVREVLAGNCLDLSRSEWFGTRPGP